MRGCVRVSDTGPSLNRNSSVLPVFPVLSGDSVIKMDTGAKWTNEAETFALLEAYREKTAQIWIEGMKSNEKADRK